MTSSPLRGVRHGLLLLAAGSSLGAVASAQTLPATTPQTMPPGAVVQRIGPDDGAELRGYLTTLADNPRSVDALVGAGRAALRSGDVEASLNFFERAWELSPRDARARAGMASALVNLGQPQAALGMFTEAVSYGAPEAEIAADRGLALDLTGQTRRAQQDYVAALRRRDDAEIRRRLALSLAISGERDAALRLIDPQLRAHDRAGWRTQAFVLALTGDAAGAQRTAQNVMPAGTAQAMSPFLAQLAGLSPSQKAMAVHLGRFPNGGRPTAVPAPADSSADPAAIAFAWGGRPPVQVASVVPNPPPAPPNRRRSGSRNADERRSAANRREERNASRTARPPVQTPERRPARAETVRVAQRAPSPPPPTAAPATVPARAPETRPTQLADVGTRWAGSSPPATPAPSPPRPAATPAPATTTPSLLATSTPTAVASPGYGAPSTPAATPAPPPVTASRFAAQPTATSTPSLLTTATPTTVAPSGYGAPPASAAVGGAVPPSLSSTTSTQLAGTSTPAPLARFQPAPVGTATTMATPAPAAPALGASSPATASIGLAPSSSAPSLGASDLGASLPARIETVDIAPSTTPEPASPAASEAGLSDIADLVRSLPAEPAPPPSPPVRASTPATPPAAAATTPRRTRTAAADRPAATRPRPPAHPSRHWVQIAGGANRDALPREFARLRTLAPEQLGRRTAYTTPLRATNRLLVGPFTTEREAQEFVNQLTRRNLSAFAWTSEAGQEVERLPAGR